MNKKHVAGLILALMLPLVAFGGEKYPLTMTAVFTRGHIDKDHRPSRYATFHSGEFDCTDGDEHRAPVCDTPIHWAEMDRMSGTPDTVVFTMEDGAVFRVQSSTEHQLPGYLVCTDDRTIGDITTNPSYVVYCALYFKLLMLTQSGLKLTRTEVVNGYQQEVSLSPEEMTKADQDWDKKVFGDGDIFRATVRYKLMGKPNKRTGGQAIEVPTDRLPPLVPGIKNSPIIGAYLPNSR